MRETTPSAMPPCFEKWCKRFDDFLRTKAQKREFRHYLGGLLGESERKNIYQMASDSVGVTYHKLHHFSKQGGIAEGVVSLMVAIAYKDDVKTH